MWQQQTPKGQGEPSESPDLGGSPRATKDGQKLGPNLLLGLPCALGKAGDHWRCNQCLSNACFTQHLIFPHTQGKMTRATIASDKIPLMASA